MNQKFEIPQVVKDSYPKLVNLILEAKSMNDEEKQYWFRILPVVQKNHVKKLFKILITEKKELEKIDMEYKQNLQKLQNSRQDFKMDSIKKKAKSRKKIEEEYEKNEELLEAEILKEIESMEE
ncbi:hypothetical protein HOJ01_04320 [bacterium]|jgi:hypothetical protein|nr:hypothetical protein [bacterium]MBT6294003.1 hypothetical protein [bacterium]